MIRVEEHGPVIAIRMARGFLGRPLAWVTAYWVDGLLIDTGPACTARELLRVLKRVEVRQIALTHAHEETIGGLAALRTAYPQATVYASSYALETLAQPDRLRIQWYRRLAWGLPLPVKDVIALEEVDHLLTTPAYCLRAVETPGHTQDHVSYFEAYHRWVFCGDAYTPGALRTWPQDTDLFGVVSSLRTLADLRPQRLFPANTGVRRSALPDIHERIGFFVGLAREVARLDAAGVSPQDMAEQLFHDEPRSPLWTEGHLTVANLVDALRSYNALTEPYPAQEPLHKYASPGQITPTKRPRDSTSSTDSSRKLS